MAAKPKPTSKARASVLIKAAMEALNETGAGHPARRQEGHGAEGGVR